MNILKNKLFQIELEKQSNLLDSFSTDKSQIAFGSQIRSYVFHPYSLVKDHRTNFEVGNSKKVLDGDLDDFVLEYLRSL
jgi:peptide chain release factor 2